MSFESEPDSEPAASRTADSERAASTADAERQPGRCSRRAVLGAALATAGVSAPVTGSVATVGADATLQVTVHPGSTPLYARLRDGVGAVRDDWTSAHAAAMTAVRDALEQIETHARATGRDWIDTSVVRGDSLGSRLAASSPLDALASPSHVYDAFRGAIGDGRDDPCCRLLCWWGPFDYRLGYGRTIPGDGRVGRGDRSAGLAVANVGATEGWDGRPVTRNVAIHEVLHTFLSPIDAAAVGDSRCDHDLGTVRKHEGGVREVSPMATTYAGGGAGDRGPLRLLVDGLTASRRGGTRWAGRGCVDREAVRDDGTEASDVTWRHSTRLTPETKAAVCRYVERTMG